MSPRNSPTLRTLLIEQEDVIGLWQLPDPLRRAVLRATSGEWQLLGSRVVLARPGPPTRDQKRWAALLHCGPHARLSGCSALQLHGWRHESTATHDVLVPHKTQPPKGKQGLDWLRIRRTRLPITGPAPVPQRTSPHLATVHAAAWARSSREAMFIVISVLQQGISSHHHLRGSLSNLPKLPRRSLVMSVAKEYHDGVESLNELDFAAVCRRYSVPEPVRQRRILDEQGKLRAIDVEFRTRSGRALRVEVEGLHHLQPQQYFADITRHNDLAFASPATAVRITTWHLEHEAAPFMAGLRRAIDEW